MMPLISLCIVIAGIFVVAKVLLYFQNKLHVQNKNELIRKKSTYCIDEKYKIVVVSINGEEKTLLLGPTQAIVLDSVHMAKTCID